jgi:hypothetical protein
MTDGRYGFGLDGGELDFERLLARTQLMLSEALKTPLSRQEVLAKLRIGRDTPAQTRREQLKAMRELTSIVPEGFWRREGL